MTRRTKWVAGGAVAVAAITAGQVAVWWFTPPPEPCGETFVKVKTGMTREAVIAMVGAPPSGAVEYHPFWDRIPGGEWARCSQYERWEGTDRVELTVGFDADGRVRCLQFGAPLDVPLPLPVESPSFFDRLRARFGL